MGSESIAHWTIDSEPIRARGIIVEQPCMFAQVEQGLRNKQKQVT